MNRVAVLLAFFIVKLWIASTPSALLAKDVLWDRVDEGLFVKEFDPPGISTLNDPRIIIVRIDPRLYSFKLLSVSEQGGVKMTPKQWCQKYNLLSAINAGMYQEDGMRNVGYMKNFNHINNPRLNNTYKAVLAFNPVDSNIPEVHIIDLQCQDFDKLKTRYHTFVQDIRMINCRQENVWSKQNKAWSMAVLGMDKDGNALFIFSGAPYSGHDFGNILLSLPISIYNAMYLEGGPESGLYFSDKGVQFERVGIYDTGFREDPIKLLARSVPNVIGIERKRK
jgi:hypothetical protein